MPRPGPRPYECVRRAWHSDRHQPMRGSLIQEIFRVVNEIHSSVTRKNKEWQEKLPIVVLRAEEIMYSKANSEVEYMDPNTLWERANDAINTIIRRDESTETGDLLQPCIEAALNLGCAPRRASRSQRIDNPRCYLSASTLEPTCLPPNCLDDKIQGNHTTNGEFVSHTSKFTNPVTTNLILLGSECHSSILPINNHTAKKFDQQKKFPFLSANFPPCVNTPHLSTETYASSNRCSVYPLYYGNQHQSQVSQLSFRVPPIAKPAETGRLHNLFPASNTIPKADSRDAPESPPGIGCDLSLRLGALSVPCISIENSWPQKVEDVDSRTSRGGNKASDLTPRADEEFSFFPKANANANAKWSGETEKTIAGATKKKRKASNHLSDDRQFFFALM